MTDSLSRDSSHFRRVAFVVLRDGFDQLTFQEDVFELP